MVKQDDINHISQQSFSSGERGERVPHETEDQTIDPRVGLLPNLEVTPVPQAIFNNPSKRAILSGRQECVHTGKRDKEVQ